jgi:CubicO group peptidase (beta-lactamase class C family)
MKRYRIFAVISILFSSVLNAQNSNSLNTIVKRANDSIPSLGAFLIWKNDKTICEEYFNGANANTNFKVKSVTKSVVSALAGIANDCHLLPQLNTPIFDLFPEYATDFTKNEDIGFPELIKSNDSLKRIINLHDMLTMQTGYLWDDNSALSSRVFNSSSDPVRSTLDLPFEDFPGTTFKYCTPASHVVAAVIAKSIDENLKTFADTALFKPIGVNIDSWSCDPLGRTMGGTELSMKATDMLKFGLLYLNEGQANGKQIISKAWIQESTSAKVELNEWDVLPQANGYGYYWWRRKVKGHQAFVASGYGGQLICVIPDLQLVIVTTCFVNENNRGRSEIKRLHGFIDQIIEVSK